MRIFGIQMWNCCNFEVLFQLYMRIIIEIPETNYHFFRELVEMLPFAKVVRNYFAPQTVIATSWADLSMSMGKEVNVCIPDMENFYKTLPDYLQEDGAK